MIETRTKFDHFNETFESNLTAAPTYKEAYYRTEDTFRRMIGYTPYKNYESFRVIRHNKLKEKRKEITHRAR